MRSFRLKIVQLPTRVLLSAGKSLPTTKIKELLLEKASIIRAKNSLQTKNSYLQFPGNLKLVKNQKFSNLLILPDK